MLVIVIFVTAESRDALIFVLRLATNSSRPTILCILLNRLRAFLNDLLLTHLALVQKLTHIVFHLLFDIGQIVFEEVLLLSVHLVQTGGLGNGT